MIKRIKNFIKRVFNYIIHGVRPVIVKANVTFISPQEKLAGKRIIVTGGSRGIGLAMARKFTEEGAVVLITGRSEEVLKKASAEVGCNYAVLDMLNSDSFCSFIEDADKVLGGVDCLVNNAGVSLHEKSFFDVTRESFDFQMNTNFRGPFFLTQCFIRRLQRNLEF